MPSEDGPLWRLTYGDSETGLTEEEHIKRRDMSFSKECCPDTRDSGQYKVVVTQTSTLRIHNRRVDSMRVGRVLLAGDAAHVCNPFGGYGCMAAVFLGRSRPGLADCLAGHHQGRAGESILDDHAQVRRETFLAFVDRRSRKNMRRIYGAHDVGKLLETDSCLALLKRVEGDAEATRKFLLVSSWPRMPVPAREFQQRILEGRDTVCRPAW